MFPNPAKAEDHVRLGDIVVSGKGGVAKYDFVKEHRDRIEPQHAPRAPSASLLSAARRLAASALEGVRRWEDHLERAVPLGAPRPSSETDRLADAGDPSKWLAHPEDADRRPGRPRVFHGTIGAADRLQRSAIHRDKLRDQFGVRAIEMEGAGVAEAAWLLECSFFIIRGICDYCDTNKSDVWQSYAAVVAAAYARALLEETATVVPNVSSRPSGPSSLDEGPSARDVLGGSTREPLARRPSGPLTAALLVLATGVLIGWRAGSWSAGTSSSIERAWRGMRRISPRRSSSMIIWCTVGGVTQKKRWMSASAGGGGSQGVGVDEGQVLALLLGEARC